MPAAQAQPSPASIAASLTSEILHELVLDVAIEEHRLAGLRRARAAAGPATGLGGVANGLLAAPLVNGASTSPSKKDDGLFECLVCARQIAAPRYASHLSSCMGLTGSRRGAERRAAVANGRGTGTPRPASVASSHGSDTDTANKPNGIKRAATASPAGGVPRPKKQKPAPLVPALYPAGGQYQPPHTGSHPLSKTMSLPSSPITPGSSPLANALPPPNAHVPHAQQLQAPPMQARKSLPGTSAYGQPAPSPSVGSKRPPHPLAQSPLHTTAHPGAMVMSDRPDSDSEDSDAEVAKPQAQKTPRVPPQAVAPGTGAASGAPGGATVGGAPQKAPRKAMPARKAGRAVDSGSDSDDVASEGTDSD